MDRLVDIVAVDSIQTLKMQIWFQKNFLLYIAHIAWTQIINDKNEATEKQNQI